MSAAGTGVRAQVVAILSRRYPCQAIPYGTLKVIAAELGVSGERVRQIANEEGWGDRLRVAALRERRVCARCGENSPQGHSIFCSPCSWVELPCAHCGSPVKRRAARMGSDAGAYGDRRRAQIGAKPGYTGRVFCDHRCQGAYMGLRNSKTFRESVSA